jgi:hypothetical protein
MESTTDVLVNAANNVAYAISLQDAAGRLGRDPETYSSLVEQRLDTLLSYLRLED